METHCSSCGASLTQQDAALAIGTALGKYQLEQVLGQGGFGITYLALDSKLKRQVAIKELFPEGSTRQGINVIPPALLGASGFLETKARFLAEAQALAQFSHPSIVRIFDVFETQNTAYLVMEALSGETLGQRLLQGALPPVEVKWLGLLLSEALEEVHAAGWLHRDIKPDNIFLLPSRVVLIDFGSARAFAVGAVQKHTRLVTPGYAAPEQYASEAQFAAYTDVYGLAATLYHALVGLAPPSAVDRMLGKSLLHLPQSELGNVIAQGMEIAVQQRPSSVAEFAELLKKSVATIPATEILQTTSPVVTIPQKTSIQPIPSIAPPLTIPKVVATPTSPTQSKPPKRSGMPIVISMLGLLFVGITVVFLPQSQTIQNTSVLQQPNPQIRILNAVKNYASTVYNAYKTLDRNERLSLFGLEPEQDCMNPLLDKTSALFWYNPPSGVTACRVSLVFPDSVVVLVVGIDGSTSVNGE